MLRKALLVFVLVMLFVSLVPPQLQPVEAATVPVAEQEVTSQNSGNISVTQQCAMGVIWSVPTNAGIPSALLNAPRGADGCPTSVPPTRYYYGLNEVTIHRVGSAAWVIVPGGYGAWARQYTVVTRYFQNAQSPTPFQTTSSTVYIMLARTICKRSFVWSKPLHAGYVYPYGINVLGQLGATFSVCWNYDGAWLEGAGNRYNPLVIAGIAAYPVSNTHVYSFPGPAVYQNNPSGNKWLGFMYYANIGLNNPLSGVQVGVNGSGAVAQFTFNLSGTVPVGVEVLVFPFRSNGLCIRQQLWFRSLQFTNWRVKADEVVNCG